MQTINNYLELLDKIKENNICVIKIGTTWCGPCKVTHTNMENMEKIYPDVCFINVDADDCDGHIVEHFHVMSVPTTVVTKGGEVISKEVGLQTIQHLEERIAE